MKVFLRLIIGFSLLHLTFEASSQCNGEPIVSNPTHTDITSTTATLGGDVTNEGSPGVCNVDEIGIEWSTTAGGPYTTVTGPGSGAGLFTVAVTFLPSATQIFYRGYAVNGFGTGYTTERNFYTLATEPGAHAASLTAITVNDDEIQLQFPAASSISNADGYVILMRQGSNATLSNLIDGSLPSGADDFKHLLTNTTDTDYTVSGLTPNTIYYFAIVPYNKEGDDATYNFLTTPGFPTANATTEADIAIGAITGGLAGSTLNSSSTDRALVGFSLNASGPVTFQSVIIHLSSPTTDKFSNFRLCASSNSTFDGVGTDTPLTSGITITPTATEITITLSEALLASPTRNFFLVADVGATVNALTPSVQFSYDENDFTFSPNNIDGTVSQNRTYNFADVTDPVLISSSPADNTTVDFNTDKLILTFDENVDNIDSPGASSDDHRVIIKDGLTDAVVIKVDREDIDANGTTTVEIPIPSGTFEPNKEYYVLIGNAVIEDVPADNDWDGILDPTVLNFTTSGVIVNNVTSEICSGSFQLINDIVISEAAQGDFITSGTSGEIFLQFEDTDFGFDISGVTVSAGPAGNTDITTIQLNPKTLTRLTLYYTLDGTNDKIDVITISGLKVYASSPGGTRIVSGSSIGGVWAANAPVIFATINVGTTTPAAPVLETSPVQDLLFCKNEDISTATVAVEDDGGTFTWYNNASLSVQLATGFQVAVEADLGIDASAVGTVKRYVVRVDGCQSAPLEMTFQVAPIPVADAGPATATVCSGSSITIGGSPTLSGPSVTGTYQYLWSTNPPGGFTDLGSNPTVSPVHDSDTTFNYTVKIVDANNCASDILDPNATIAVAVDSTDEVIVYDSPLSTSFTLNSDPIELKATPSINSSYSGNGVYLSAPKYYFDPDLAGTTGSPHAITYTTNLTNGCPKTEVRNFAVSSSSGSIVNLASSYCQNEPAKPEDELELGTDWSNDLAANNAEYSAKYGYTYKFYDFQTYLGTNTPGTGVVGGNVNDGQPQYINPGTLQPYPPGNGGTGTEAYVGMRVRKHTPAKFFLGIQISPETYGPLIFWNYQYVNIYPIPVLRVSGLKNGQIICDVDDTYELEANLEAGTYEISRDGVNYVDGPTAGIVDNPADPGNAIFNPHNAFISTDFAAPNNNAATETTTFYIRYTYIVPGTSGSNSSACETSLTIQFQISPNPSVAWVPFSETEFCFEAEIYLVKTNTPDSLEFDVITGYGIFDNGDGTASFDPNEGLKAKAFATNNPPYTDYNTAENIIISATRTDANGCNTTINQTVQVRPLFPASFTESDLDVCYEDGAQDIVGGQSNGYYDLTHPNLDTVNFAQTTITGFNLRTYFDNAVSNGADGTVSQKFNLTFNTSDPNPIGCSNSITKIFNINPPLTMDIVGMTPGMIVCGNDTPFELTGNQGAAGSFKISPSPGSGFVSNALGLNNTTSGKATFTPAGASVPPGDPQKSLYIRFSFLGAGCTGAARTTEELIINPQPAITFSGSIPPANTQYCFEQSNSPTTVELTTNQISDVTFSGFGITNNGNGNATFNPTSAYQQSSLAANFNPQTDQTIRNIEVKATRTDAYSCTNTAIVTYIVNPLPTATFAPTPVEYCYEDDPVTLSGGQTNVSYQFIYKNTSTPPNYSPPVIFQSTTVFDPQQIFDDAVSKGANSLATLQFDVIYTSINSSTGCTNKKAPVTFTVSPRIPVEIAGIDEGDIFCSNVADKELVFNPPNGNFRINGITEPYSNGKYLFDPPIDGPSDGKDYTFTYTVITGNNCTNTQEKTIKVLPSPRAIFSVGPQCDTALIAYNADPSTNLSSASYTWKLSDVVKTGQNVEHRFPGVSTYSVQLKVEHPPYMVNTSTTLVCSDSLRLDQIVGPYPTIDFNFFNVCEEDETNFQVVYNIPISTASWDFGDGEITGFGLLSNQITGSAITSGTYQNPIHQYGGASNQIAVKVIGKTSENFGGCETTFEREISILKKWAPTPNELSYDMSKIDNGRGFWVIEDKQGNSSWEFNAPAKARINTAEMAWVTGASLPYNADDVSYVNSPCFDLSTFTRPVVSIKHWTDTEPSDGAVLQYSIDGGENWQRLGNVASGLDWYNRLTISSNPGEQTDLLSGWSISDQLDWAVGKHTLDVLPFPRDQVRFRVAFSSFNNREGRDGFAFNNIVIEERNRTILVENFTNVSQQANNTAYKDFKTVNFNPNELVKLQYHHASAGPSGSPPDQFNQDNPVDQNARAAFYGVTDPARAFIDGGFGQASGNFTFTSNLVVDTYFGLRSLVSSPMVISIDFETEPSDKLNVRATIQAINTIPQTGRYNVFIAIAEQNVSGQAYVLRKFLPDASGTPLTSFSETDPAQEIISSYDMRHVTRLPNGDFAPIAVIVFIQNLETKDVLQTAMRQDATPSSGIVTGMETALDNYIKLYPNPADHALNIILPAPVKLETPLQIFDTFGKQVFEGIYKLGEHVKTVETKTLSSGVYLIQLSTPEGLVRKKAMVVHE